MICLQCEEEKFTEKRVKLEQEFKGETVTVVTPAMTCDSCGFHHLSDEQANELKRKTVDAYREEKKLLTSYEIRGYRETLGMSQASFASYIGVGTASVKRWETYYVQDKSQDDLIRIRCDAHFASMNALEVGWINDTQNEFNGFRRFDLEIFKNVLAKIVEVATSPLYFFKALFYVDFIHFKRFGKGITGMEYSCFEYGPIPKDYNQLIEYVIAKNWFEKTGKYDLKSNVEFDESLFSTDELSTINCVFGLVRDNGKKYLFDKSHEEEAFKNGCYLETISYDGAKALKLG